MLVAITPRQWAGLLTSLGIAALEREPGVSFDRDEVLRFQHRARFLPLSRPRWPDERPRILLSRSIAAASVGIATRASGKRPIGIPASSTIQFSPKSIIRVVIAIARRYDDLEILASDGPQFASRVLTGNTHSYYSILRLRARAHVRACLSGEENTMSFFSSCCLMHLYLSKSLSRN